MNEDLETPERLLGKVLDSVADKYGSQSLIIPRFWQRCSMMSMLSTSDEAATAS